MVGEYDYFLLVAEELNITRAAKRAYVSEQYLSKYIKTLEARYDVVLFRRKPKLALTPAGEILVQKFQQMKALEYSLRAELNDTKNESYGVLNYGTSFGRALSVLPAVLPTFRQRYPNVSFVCKFDSATALETMVRNGHLDLFLGISTDSSPSLVSLPIIEEDIYLAVSDNMLRRYFSTEFPMCKLRFAHGIDIREFSSLPFILNPASNRIGRQIFDYLEKNEISIHSSISINANEIQAVLSAVDCGVSFCPRFLIPHVRLLNPSADQDNQLNFFPVNGMENSGTISLCYQEGRTIPNYMRYFISLVKEYFLKPYAN